MDVNNKLYGAYFNQNLTQQKPQREEKKAEDQNTPVVKAPESKPITASVSDIVAELNKFMIVGVGAPQAKSGDDSLEELIASYRQDKAKYFKERLEPKAAQAEAMNLLERVNAIIELLDESSPEYADWINERTFWENAIAQLDTMLHPGDRGINNGAGPKGVGAEDDVTENEDELYVKYCELIDRLESLSSDTPEYREIVEALLSLAEAFAQNNPTGVETNWDAIVRKWSEILEELDRGGRGANDGTQAGDVEPIASAENQISTLADLQEENNRIWNYVINLLDVYQIDHSAHNFLLELDDENTPDENYEISKPLEILRNKLIEDGKTDIIDSLRIIVRKYVDRLSYLYNNECPGLDRENLEKLCLKDPMEFGIIVQLLEGQY